ncbi:MAG: polysaccharide biosynthesis protein, partial [Clostridia bacterium]|nr:polysaccharide biosynthesis protein [Clostridia bacterium]
ELLFRKQVDMLGDKTRAYYKDKAVMITGGGGSIGSELARQIAKMQPKKLILLDVYENGVYDVQQELKIQYDKSLDLSVEILSVTNKEALEEVFKANEINIILHAAAHKHVPLMEHNAAEAVENNVFGTKNVVELDEKYGVERFIMVSTDKAVNPTNVMGATKRLCEMIVFSHSLNGKTVFTATRFGNVLGSAGSVIPLFRRQIANGGPVTITDKRIIRYFMTIPEASQLVLTSGAFANNGELFVLDMGKPVKILTLAENLIRLSGFTPYVDISIQEIGLRPGEKLYEELLIKTEELEKTENDLIFVERDEKITEKELEEKLEILSEAVATRNSHEIRVALRKIIPTYRKPVDVNSEAQQMIDMQTSDGEAASEELSEDQ